MYSRMRFDSFGKGLGLDGRRDPEDVLRMQIVQSNTTHPSGLMPFAPKLSIPNKKGCQKISLLSILLRNTYLQNESLQG